MASGKASGDNGNVTQETHEAGTPGLRVAMKGRWSGGSGALAERDLPDRT